MLRQDRTPAIERDDEMTTLARRERRAPLGEKALRLARIHECNVGVARIEVNKCVARASRGRAALGRSFPEIDDVEFSFGKTKLMLAFFHAVKKSRARS